MSYDNITLEKEGSVALLTINRPKALNALNADTFNDLDAALCEVAIDEEVGALVITGSGDKAFVAGADITEINAIDAAYKGEVLSSRGQAVFNLIEELGKPVIAAVNGFALGGGCELALACDIRIAADTAKLGLPEINLGLIPGYAGTQRLPRLVGKGMAKKLIFTGDMIDAADALRIGLVEEVVAADALIETAMKLGAKLATKAPLALAMAKRTVNEGMETDLSRGQAFEAANFGLACATEDCKEGTTAFLEKRKAEFKGR